MTSQTTDTVQFTDLNLRDEVLQSVAESGYQHPTPIQAQAIPLILDDRDLIGIAQTGTGKTAAFVLPMIHKLASGRARARMPRSVILSPTRELATQTSENFEVYGKHLKLTKALLIGGVGMVDQEKLLDRGVDVLIATPGRMLDFFGRGKILLGGVEILVIDEADRMLDMGFIPDVERIASLLIKRHQTMLFSATMPPEVRKLSKRFLIDPAEIQVAPPATTAKNVDHFLATVSDRDKFGVLTGIIRNEKVEKAIVFCNRKKDVSSLNRQLRRDGFNAQDIHGDLDQRQRTATLEAFKGGEVDYLVATDVAARGLDVNDMPCVINFDVPYNAEDYVHRIGRTGRAGKAGRAYTLAVSDDYKLMKAITRLIDKEIMPYVVAGSEVDTNGASTEEAAPTRSRSGRTRGRRSDTSAEQAQAAPAPTAEAQPSPAAEAAPTPEEPGSQEPATARSEKPSRSRSEPSPRQAPRRARRERQDDKPVVGLGDHTPSFLLRPVKLRQTAAVSEG